MDFNEGGRYISDEMYSRLYNAWIRGKGTRRGGGGQYVLLAWAAISLER